MKTSGRRVAGLEAFVQAEKAGSYAQALKSSGLAEGLTEGSLAFSFAKVRVVADDPMKILQDSTDNSTRLLPKLLPEFESLDSELVLVSPYFVPGDAGVDHLRALVAARGESAGSHQFARLDGRAGRLRRLQAIPPGTPRSRGRTA